ncbi:hypothetical protein MAPG_02266 [Magnaporthiopsis poae ATCC 64411]|uniref:C2H2-type domain-containing protein n=1 Tax=Magnaporthiopsis poae (strain ATCC 64411 / 73-15) TaxID=644358 RepID=A0A0C4DQW8_MAGP6|nr:hypothetical protein MAPG_02266 [Magnaporthiopsis poae ATCC 64411]
MDQIHPEAGSPGAVGAADAKRVVIASSHHKQAGHPPPVSDGDSYSTPGDSAELRSAADSPSEGETSTSVAFAFPVAAPTEGTLAGHEDNSPGESVSQKSHGIKACLEAAVSAASAVSNYSAINHSALKETRDQFFVWAGNMGAMHKPSSKMSLENRLSDTEGVLRHIHRLLEDLHEALEDIVSFISSFTEPSGEDDDATPAVQNDDQMYSESLMEEISDSLGGLFRAGILVRRASARDRFTHALQASTPSFSASFDIDYVENKFPKLRRSAGELRWLISHLGKANTKRRRVQKYYRDHKARLAAPQAEDERDGAKTEWLSSKATTLAPGRLSVEVEPTLVGEEDDSDAMSFTTALTTFDGERHLLSLPRLSDISPDQQPFECPICFVLCTFRSEKAWKLHAFADIRPYVCTLGGSRCEELFFPDRNSWFQHELSQHRAQFTCTLCQSEPFDSSRTFRDHLQTHRDCSDERIDDLEVAGRAVKTAFTAKDCPFCSEWETAITARSVTNSSTVSGPHFKRHVATHLEQLALFSVPRAVGEETEIDGDTSNELDSASSRSDIRAQYLQQEEQQQEEQRQEEQQSQAPAPAAAATASAAQPTGYTNSQPKAPLSTFNGTAQAPTLPQAPAAVESPLLDPDILDPAEPVFSRQEFEQWAAQHRPSPFEELPSAFKRMAPPSTSDFGTVGSASAVHSPLPGRSRDPEVGDLDAHSEREYAEYPTPLDGVWPPPEPLKVDQELEAPEAQLEALKTERENRKDRENSRIGRVEEAVVKMFEDMRKAEEEVSRATYKVDVTNAKKKAEEAEAEVAQLKAEIEAAIRAKEAAKAVKAKAEAQEAEWLEKLKTDLKDLQMLEAEMEAAAKATKETEKARAAEESRKAAEKQEPSILFKDAVGRKFRFPLHLCQTWQGMEELINAAFIHDEVLGPLVQQGRFDLIDSDGEIVLPAGMEELIKQAFLHVEVLGPLVQQGHFDLIGPDGEIILPAVWDKVIQPDSAITMHMWPMDKRPNPPPPGGSPPGMPPQPHGHDALPGVRPISRRGDVSPLRTRRPSPGPPPPSWWPSPIPRMDGMGAAGNAQEPGSNIANVSPSPGPDPC